jgi:hypothetical protein
MSGSRRNWELTNKEARIIRNIHFRKLLSSPSVLHNAADIDMHIQNNFASYLHKIADYINYQDFKTKY